MSEEKKISLKPLILISFFITLNILAVSASTKVVSVFGWGIPGGSLIIAIASVIEGIIAELYGTRMVSKVTTLAISMSWVWILLMAMFVILPGFSGWNNQDAFASIFGFSFRIGLAGLVTVLTIFNVRGWINSASFISNNYVRNYTGAVLTQVIDSVMFTCLAFIGVLSTEHILEIIWQGFLIKMLLELILGAVQPRLVDVLKKHGFDSWYN